jgi:hypothetical protein
VATFLSEEWFEQLNAVLRAAGAVPLDETHAVCRVVVELVDAPAGGPQALTLTLEHTGASAVPDGVEDPDAAIRLTFDDAQRLTAGTFDSASALREGRVKLRGDLSALMLVVGWLQQAHPRAE